MSLSTSTSRSPRRLRSSASSPSPPNAAGDGCAWREQLEVNVLGQVAVTEAMLPFIRAAHGRIVFMGSISGKVATQLKGPYGASKFAIEAIGESPRSELRP